MSDIAWSRVERGLWARIDAAAPEPAPSPDRRGPSSWRWWLVAAPLAAAAILTIFVGLRVILPVDSGSELTRVVSPPAPSAPSAVSFDDSHIELEPDTALAMGHEAGHPLVLLERGAARFSVAPRRSRAEFVVRAGDAVVRVVGTRFRVERARERIAVQVDHGQVDVQFRGRVVAVAAGQRWSSDSPAQASTLATATAAAPVAPGEPATENDAGTEPEIEIEIEPPEQGSARAPKRAPRPVIKSAPAGSAAEPAPAPTPPAPADQGAAVDRERAEYERLAALEPSSPETAQAGYMQLAKGSTRWAELALYAAARLAVDRHDRRAETLLGMYLQRFPGGANAQDALRLLSRVKAERARGDDRP